MLVAVPSQNAQKSSFALCGFAALIYLRRLTRFHDSFAWANICSFIVNRAQLNADGAMQTGSTCARMSYIRSERIALLLLLCHLNAGSLLRANRTQTPDAKTNRHKEAIAVTERYDRYC
jgi:hypothetical protein